MADEAGIDFSTAWAKALTDLESIEIGPQQRAFLSQARPVTLVEGTAVIAVPSDFARAQVEQRLRAHIVDALSAALGRPVGLAVSVSPPADGSPAGTLLDPVPPPPPMSGFREPNHHDLQGIPASCPTSAPLPSAAAGIQRPATSATPW